MCAAVAAAGCDDLLHAVPDIALDDWPQLVFQCGILLAGPHAYAGLPLLATSLCSSFLLSVIMFPLCCMCLCSFAPCFDHYFYDFLMLFR